MMPTMQFSGFSDFRDQLVPASLKLDIEQAEQFQHATSACDAEKQTTRVVIGIAAWKW